MSPAGPPGAPGTRFVDVGNMRYRGEVLVAEAFQPEHGEPLGPDLDFRLVFFTLPRRIAQDHIRDRRIAMASPARSPDTTRQGLAAELTAIRETKARYSSGPTPQVAALSAPMAEREHELRAQIARRDAAKYSGGRVYTRQCSSIDASEVFVGDDFDAWVSRLAGAVLSQTCERPAFDQSLFPGSLTTDVLSGLHIALADLHLGLANLHLGLVGHVAAKATLEDFGPALGLAGSGNKPGPAIDLVHAYVGSRGGDVPASGLIRTLGEEHGVSADLAALYLMAFAVAQHGEIGLSDGHKVLDQTGQPLQSEALSWDLVPEVRFAEGMGRDFVAVRSAASSTESAAAPYIAAILGSRSEGAWPAVAAALESLGRLGEEAAATAVRLTTALGEPANGTLESAASGLQTLAEATNHSGLVAAAREQFGSPSALGEAIRLAKGMGALGPAVEPIIESTAYLAAMCFAEKYASLEVERDSTLGRMNVEQLAGQPSLWSVIEPGVSKLKEDFRVAYEAHHDAYHRRGAEQGRTLIALATQVGAIDRLNQMSEMGDPVDPGVVDEYGDALAAVKSCPILAPAQPDLSIAPVCPGCDLALADEIPDADSVAQRITEGMAEHGRRLASLAAGRILEQGDKPGLTKFLQLVQAGDAASIANVLDDEVAEFLREFVSVERE
jgi:hypothetical protein